MKVVLGMFSGRVFAATIFLAATTMGLSAQTFNVLANFSPAVGADPFGSLVQGINGDIYGTADYGGNDACQKGCGTVFKTSVAGGLVTLSSLNGTDGFNPPAGVTLAANGKFYGVAYYGGSTGNGTIFQVTQSGTLTTLHNFDNTDGSEPASTLVQGLDGALYGTTFEGGTNTANEFVGTVFRITVGGALTTLYSFCSLNNCADGKNPRGNLLQASNGNFYGTTTAGGFNRGPCSGGCGTIFEITPAGKLTTLHKFCSLSNCADGIVPQTGVVLAPNGNLYGTTEWGGANTCTEVSIDYGCGTVFEITPSGELTTLYNFCSQDNCTDGSYPSALILGSDGNLYGTTSSGGVKDCGLRSGCGTVFEITPSGTLTTLHNFVETDGGAPGGALLQDTNGTFYGTASIGGANSCVILGLDFGCGTFYSLSTGLNPFVEAIPNFAKTGATIGILGSQLNGATSVTFDGVSAVFTVKSGTLIEATVPAGATSGAIQVTTPGGTLSSNAGFQVIP